MAWWHQKKWGEVPIAYIVKKAECEVSEEDIVAHCKSKLASYKAVKDVVFVDALPRNAVGKILKMQLKDLQNIFGFTTPQAIYKWQHGTALPTVDNLVVLAMVFHVRLEEILVMEVQEGIPVSA